VFTDKTISPDDMLQALKTNFADNEDLAKFVSGS